MGQGRVELPTSRLSGVRSNHLSYWPSETGSCLPVAGLAPEGAFTLARAYPTGQLEAMPRSLETESYVLLFGKLDENLISKMSGL